MKTAIIMTVVFMAFPNLMNSQVQRIESSSAVVIQFEEEGSEQDRLFKEFMTRKKMREGYFLFDGDLYPPAPVEDDQLPKQFITFEFMGQRYFEDPERYYFKGKPKEDSVTAIIIF